jgi:DNA-binding YbaB/EbfC family protein
MSKGKGRRMPPGLSGGGGRSGVLKQLQGLQEDVLKAQDEIAEMNVSATAGGGAVTAVVSGDKRVVSIAIKPEVVDPEDVEMLQDLVVAAVNEGLEKIDKAASERLSAVTSGLSIPGLG